MIDDGSTDDSGKICDELAASDNRIKSIHKENGGISSARNAGLDMMQGDFFAFVDSDDWIEANYIETLEKHIEGVDIVVTKASAIRNEDALSKTTFEQECIIGNAEIREKFLVSDEGLVSPVAKLYSNKFTNIRFDEKLAVGEDRVFNIEVLKIAEQILYIDYTGYNIRVHFDSTTKTIAGKYTYLYEHDYTVIRDRIDNALRSLGMSEEQMKNRDILRTPNRYFLEIKNLFNTGTPYSRKEVILKIREIHKDKDFRNKIKKAKWRELSTVGKVSKVCSILNSAYFTYFLFAMILGIFTRRIKE